MINNEKFDIFIAYYGSTTNGSESKAHELYKYLINKEIFPDKKIKPYFHPITNPYGRFEDTPLIVARTPMFVLVTDKKIKKNIDGQILMYRENGTLSNIYEEIRTFHDSPMYKSFGGDQAVKLFLTDDFNVKEAEHLHPVFSGRSALKSKEAVSEWIIYFYKNTYLSRLYKQYKYLIQNNLEDFTSGYWVSEAEEMWQYTYDEDIGRILMIYYTMQASQTENKDALCRLRLFYDKYHLLEGLSTRTQNVLKQIRKIIYE